MTHDTMPAQTRLAFRWHPARHKECYQAINAAVRLGFDTRDALLAALPQFSVNRLVLALDTLIAAGAAETHGGRLLLGIDLALLDEFVQKPMELPLDKSQCTEPVVRDILRSLGIADPETAMGLLRFDVQMMGARDGS